MKISLKWMNELFPGLEVTGGLQARSAELREKLPLSGFEIGQVLRAGDGIAQVTVGEVLSLAKHPNADKLNVCQVRTGKQIAAASGTPGAKAGELGDEVLQIVCGAPNVRAGMRVALATVGTVLPGDFKIKAAQIRGVDSFGMLCSEKELGLSQESAGLMDLPAASPVGTSLVKALGLSDEIWDVELTPDRGDCLSHWGMAREISRLLNVKPVTPEADPVAVASSDVPMLSVEIQATRACPFYGAQLFDNVRNGPSPEWLRRRLESLGLRSHNALVDLTNFVLMEFGHPLHAFDADKIAGSKILVRFAKNGEKIKTLDGVDRVLTAQDLVIADLEKPLALAGVMGSFESGVTEQTQRVVLECAVFDKDVVRATARRHKIQSDASYRFERGVDIANRTRVAGRATLLIRQLTQARRRGAFVEIAGDAPERGAQPWTLNFDLRAFKDVVGIDAQADEVARAFAAIMIDSQTRSPNVLRVEVPTHRHDLTREIDLIEEAARLLGYARIPVRYPPQRQATRGLTSGLYHRVRQLRRRLVETGLTEMMPYAFVSAEQAKYLGAAPLLEIENPLSAQWQYMRPTLSFGLLEVVARHAGLGQMNGSFFDQGSVFLRNTLSDAEARGTGTLESVHVGWALMGPQRTELSEHWSSDKGSADRKAQADYFDAKGVAETLLETLPAFESRWSSAQFVPLQDFFDSPAHTAELERQAPWIPTQLLHPGRTAIVVWPGKPPGTIVGFVGELHPALKPQLLNLATGLQLGVALGELRAVPDLLAALHADAPEVANARGKIAGSRRLPVVERDLSLVVSPETREAELDRTLRKAAGPELLELRCFDLYRLKDGRVSLSFRASLQGREGTLSDEQIQSIVKKMLDAALSRHQAELRS